MFVLAESGNAEGNGDSGEEVADDDMVQIHTGGEPDPHPTIPPRWTTRVFAAQCIAKIIQECENNRAHFDLALAREVQATKLKGMYCSSLWGLKTEDRSLLEVKSGIVTDA